MKRYTKHSSLPQTAAGDYLVCGLFMSSLVYINGTTGDVIWSLGGVANNFTEPNNDRSTTLFAHHARFANDELTLLTYYDNTVLTEETKCTANCSKGRMVEINQEALTSVLIESFYHPDSLQGGPEGSYETMPNGNVLIGWGSQPTITEYNAHNNTCVFSVQFAIFNIGPDNYRAYKSDWVGEPTWNPAIASKSSNGTSNIWVSWNGATEVAQWALVSLRIITTSFI
jgi:hypothetical protein